MSSKILLRRGTAAQWSSANPILGNGELGIETDTLKIKIGNGTSTWSQLTSYANVTPSELTSAINSIIDLSPSTLDTLNELAAAINDDPNFFTSVNTSLSDKASLTSANTFTNSPQTINIASISAVGLIVQAATGQTTDIQQWKNSTGNVIGRFTKDATLAVGSSSVAPGIITAVAFSAGQNPIVIQGASGQTADLQIWRNSAGTVLAKVTSTGDATLGYAYVSGLRDVNGTGSYLNMQASTSGILVNTRAAANVGLIVKGAASQTANLQEWQDSAGTVISYITSSGQFASSRAYLSEASVGPDYTTGTQGYLKVSTYSTTKPQITVRAIASQTANLQEWQDSAGTVLSWINPSGGISLPRTSTIRFNGGAGVDRAYITSNTNNDMIFATAAGVESLRLYGGAQPNGALITSGNAAAVGLAIKAAASQTADLQQWQNSAGTVQARIASNGDFTNNGIFTVYGRFGGASFTDAAALRVNGYDTAVPTAVIKAIASQTANLQEWQNSAGSVLLNVDSTGSLDIGAGSNNIWKIKNQTSTVMEWQPGQGFCFFPYGSSNKPLTIKGTVSQSANLTEWRNSAETVIASISPTGKLTSAVDASINGMTIGLGGGNVNSNVAFGQGALASNVSGQNNTAIGYNALNSSTSYFNVAIGGSALQSLTTGGTNVALGVMAMRYATTADSAVAIGYSAAGSTTTGGYFVAIGAGALAANLTSGTDTVAIGYAALNQATATSATTAVGSGAGYALTTGIQNTYLGRVADGVTTGSNNMMLGYSATASSATVSNEITLGNSSITRFRIPGIGLNITSNSTVNTASASTVGLIIKGAASQTANLQEWQNSAGGIIGWFNAYGSFEAANSLNGAKAELGNRGVSQASTLVLKIQGFASQTANLTEWQNSAGTVLARVSSGGAFVTSAVGVFGAQSNTPNAQLYVLANSITYPTFVAKAIASQTANLTEWQNSAGTVLAYIEAGGHFGVGNLFSSFGGSSTKLGYVTVSGSLPAIIPLVVKGAASQTANLQEWQNSSGIVLANITASGSLELNGKDIELMNIMGAF